MTGRAVAIATLLSALVAHAQPSDDEAAKNHFLAGTSYYDEARYEEAMREFQEAYRLSKRPILLYNIGACHERLSRFSEAIVALKGYLAAAPKAEDRESVERRIATFEERVAKDKALAAAAEAKQAAEREKLMKEREAANQRAAELERQQKEQLAALERQKAQLAELERQKAQSKQEPPKPGPPVAPAPPGEPTTNVSFTGRDDLTHFAITVSAKNKDHTCVTPCSLALPRGRAKIAVGGGGATYFSTDLEIPRGASLVRVARRCTGCYAGGVITALAGGIAGGIALGMGDYNSTDNGVRIPSILVPVVGGVMVLIGVILFFSGGSNKVELTEETPF